MSKFTVEFSPELAAVVGGLAREGGIPKTRVLRRAIALLWFVEQERSQGHKITIHDADNRLVKEIVG
jgi:predicted transcriptional regulator